MLYLCNDVSNIDLLTHKKIMESYDRWFLFLKNLKERCRELFTAFIFYHLTLCFAIFVFTDLWLIVSLNIYIWREDIFKTFQEDSQFFLYKYFNICPNFKNCLTFWDIFLCTWVYVDTSGIATTIFHKCKPDTLLNTND